MPVIGDSRSTEPALLLLRTVCHELRPPVATLAALVRAWEEQPSPARREEIGRLAGQHASHAEAVLGQVAAAVEGLTGSPGRSRPLHRILPAVLATVPAERLDVRAGPAALDWPVPARQTSQILINLLGNAFRHGLPGAPVALWARVRRHRLSLTVVNHGRLGADLIDGLRRTEPPADDNGLGLWLVRELTGDCGGSIDARQLGPERIGLRVRLPRPRDGRREHLWRT